MTSRRAHLERRGSALALLLLLAGAMPPGRAAGPRTGAGDAGVHAQLRPGAVRDLAAGKLLVAARDLPDPNFSKTVILLAEHSRKGAMGLVLNRQTSVPLKRLFPNLNLTAERSAGLYLGGPVAQDSVVALLRSATPVADSRAVLPDVHLVGAREPLETLLDGPAAADDVRVYLGYSGWGPGQLEREAAQGAWHVFAGETAVVFDRETTSLWDRQIRRSDGRMARLATSPL